MSVWDFRYPLVCNGPFVAIAACFDHIGGYYLIKEVQASDITTSKFQ